MWRECCTANMLGHLIFQIAFLLKSRNYAWKTQLST